MSARPEASPATPATSASSGPSLHPPTVVVVTGLSGAGKSTALRTLEDLGFFCVDNLPTALAPQVVELCERANMRRVALGMDVRVREFLGEIGSVIEAIEKAGWGHVELVFCDASDEALLRRFNETRRPHPLNTAGDGALAVLDGVRLERERLAPLRARATRVIDTTNLSVHELRRDVISQFGPASGGAPRMVTRFVSFGFKYGPPVDADVVLDVRFLENPYFVRELKELPGTDPRVERFVLDLPETKEFIAKATDLLVFTLPRCEREGKSYLTVAIGCTGGRHRSVVIAAALAQGLTSALNVRIAVLHRDLARGDHARAEPVAIAVGSMTSDVLDTTIGHDATGPSSDGQTTAHELKGATSAPPPPNAFTTQGGDR
jgi:UPF0042 nucleotide-binding protein